MTNPNLNLRSLILAHLSPVILLFVGVVVAIPAVITYGTEISIIPAFLMTVFMQVFTIGILLLATSNFRNTRDILRLKNFKMKHLAYGSAVAGLFFFGLILIQAIVSQFGIETSNSETTESFNALSGVWRYVALFGFVSALGPIVEELFFRGTILGLLLQGYGVSDSGDEKLTSPKVVSSIFFVSAFFSLMHYQGFSSAMDFITLGVSFFFSAAVSILTIRSKSLYPAIASHILYNFLGALALSFI